MEAKIYQDLEPEARLKEMAQSALKRESITYTHEYTDEELNAKREELTEVVTELVDIEEEKRAYTEGLNARKKMKEQVRNELVDQIRKGGEERFDGCWKFADYENRRIGYYDASGTLVSERDMTPDEYQRQMKFEPEPENDTDKTQLAIGDGSQYPEPEDVDFEEVKGED